MTIGRKIAQIRKSNGLTQEEFGEKTGSHKTDRF